MIVKSIIHIILCPYKNGLIYEVYLYAILGNGEENSGSDMETEQGTFSCREESYMIMMKFFYYYYLRNSLFWYYTDGEDPVPSSSNKHPPDTPDIDDKVANFLAVSSPILIMY